MLKPRSWTPLVVFFLSGCAGPAPEVDLLVSNATLFDSHTGIGTPGMAVSVTDGLISMVGSVEELSDTRAEQVIDAQGRLLIPGLIDAHAHSVNVLATSFNPGGGGLADLSMDPDSIAQYRRAFSEAYLPYGVTLVRDAGSSEDDLPLLKAWMSSAPGSPDFYPCGGALVSAQEGRTPYPGHRVVRDSLDAAEVVRSYRDAGFRFIKLYWRLRAPEFRAALKEAQDLGLVPFTHVDFGVISYKAALDWGLRHFEHTSTLPVEVLGSRTMNAITLTAINQVLEGDRRGAFFMAVMEGFNQIGEEDERMLSLIDTLARSGATLTPTLHVLARPLGLTYMDRDPIGDFDDTSNWTAGQMERARRGFRVALSYVAALHEAGVKLAVGSDTVEPGRSVLSELLLLHDAGIPMAEVLQIATLGSAEVIELSHSYGSIEPGKKAHLVIFDESPLVSPEALLGGKTVIKDGGIWSTDSQGW